MIKKYDSYKDSGVEWLGDIPEHWECIRMKRLYKDVSIKNRPNELLSSVTQDRGVIPRDWIDNRMVMPTGSLETFKFIEKEDFAISLRSFEGGLEYCYHDGIISPAYKVLKKKNENLHPLFYKYLFKSISFISELQTSVVGIREGKNISFPELSYSFLPVPPLPEQTAIAQFLDDKTTKIDQAIAIKQQQIALLKERKQILIHKAVTKGVTSSAVEMKDSGVEWIGEIPEHWEVVPLVKYSTRFDYRGKTPEKVDEGIFLVTTKNIKEGLINYEISKEYVKQKDYKSIMSRGRPKIGDLLFTMEAPLGQSAVVDVENVAIAQRIIKFRFVENSFDSYFVNYFIQTNKFQLELQKEGTGSTALGIKASKLHKLKLIKPPLSEQKKISAYIETASQKIETAIGLKQQEIEKLKEYKSSLINSVVTGKVKVC